ncbi:hypothetical protein F5887DRAFT_1010455 [Amanita rubescens]|nr:hypothetical protein F5887DRAFT_1010455 [Amanita rubescens]
MDNLQVANWTKCLYPSYKLNYVLIQPLVSIPPQPCWYDKHKIVGLDPWATSSRTESLRTNWGSRTR